MKRLWLRTLWALQYPFWWIAPNSLAYHAVRVHYARSVGEWLKTRDPKEGAAYLTRKAAIGLLFWMHRLPHLRTEPAAPSQEADHG